MRDEERAWSAESSTTERTYRATQAVETLGVSRRWIKRLAALGLLDEQEQSFERIVALTAAVEVMAVREVLLSDENVTSMVEQVADALREEPSGLDLHLRVVGSFYEV